MPRRPLHLGSLKTACVALCLVPLVAAFASADGKDKRKTKPIWPIRYDVPAEHIAKEFKEDPKGAVKRYAPNPPKGANTVGARIIINGEVAGYAKEQLTLKNPHGLKVVLVVKNGPPGPGKFMASGEGRLKGFRNKTICIVIDGYVKYKPITDKGKP